MSPSTLAQTQQLLWKLITAPEGAAAGMAQLGPAERVEASALVVGDARLSAVERLDIYANMYFYRIRDALKEDFAAVCAVVGEGNFHNLITDYLIAHPPSHFSLRYAGAHLPAFLHGHALSQRWPYLVDLAQLEWAILDAFDAPDALVLDPQALAELPQNRWPALRFHLTASLRLLDLASPVHEVWKQATRGEALAAPPHERTPLRVWRQDFCVYHRAIDAAEHAALMALTAGAPFAEVCEFIAGGNGDGGAERVFALLGAWLGDGLLSEISSAQF